ncbi:MAG: serine/threonine-protein kinase [Bacteroidota bacterium]
MANLEEQEATRAFGRYQVLGVLGDGSLGRLYLAESHGVEGGPTIVAVRSFHPHLSASPAFGKALSDALRVGVGLKHPNIASIYELGEFDGRHFLTMEYLPGESLFSILARCAAPAPMSPAIAAALVHQCAEALRYAHDVRDVLGTQTRVVHRDIRPANIFVTYQGMVKVVGTGAALMRAHVVESGGAPPNSIAYTAPEEFAGGAHDMRVDVFSMGVVLWECLTGRALFHADSAAKVQDAVRSRYVEPPSVFNPEVVPGLDEVALRALSRDPKRRYQSAKEMSLAIDTAILSLGRRPTSAAMAEWLERLFGAERATLKTQIARGGGVPGALGRLRLLGGDLPPGRTGSPLSESTATHHPGQASQAGASRVALRPLVPATAVPPPPPVHVVPPEATSETRRSWPSLPIPDASGTGTPTGHRAIIPTPVPPVPRVAIPAAPNPVSPRGPLGRLSVPWLVAVGAGIASVIVAAALAIRGDGGGSAAPPQVAAGAVVALEITSTPPGAQVLVDGDPSGLATPARITGLRPGRKVEIRVDKPGFGSEKQTTEIPTSGSRTLSFRMVESVGKVHLEGVPPRAAVYVDDVPVDGGQPIPLAVGPHRLRVEVAGRLFANMKVDVRPGDQGVAVRPVEGSNP